MTHSTQPRITMPRTSSAVSRRSLFRGAGIAADAGGAAVLGLSAAPAMAAPGRPVTEGGAERQHSYLTLFADVPLDDLEGGKDATQIGEEVVAYTFQDRYNALHEEGLVKNRIEEPRAAGYLPLDGEDATGGPRRVDVTATQVEPDTGKSEKVTWTANSVQRPDTGFGLMFASSHDDTEGRLHGISDRNLLSTAGPDLWRIVQYLGHITTGAGIDLANRILVNNAVELRVTGLREGFDSTDPHGTIGTATDAAGTPLRTGTVNPNGEEALPLQVHGINILGEGPGLFLQWHAA